MDSCWCDLVPRDDFKLSSGIVEGQKGIYLKQAVPWTRANVLKTQFLQLNGRAPLDRDTKIKQRFGGIFFFVTSVLGR